jgi:hypothetical protein
MSIHFQIKMSQKSQIANQTAEVNFEPLAYKSMYFLNGPVLRTAFLSPKGFLNRKVLIERLYYSGCQNFNTVLDVKTNWRHQCQPTNKTGGVLA